MIKYKHREFTIFGPESQKSLLRNIPSEKGEENWLCFQPRGKQITVHRNKHCDWFVVTLLPLTLMI